MEVTNVFFKQDLTPDDKAVYIWWSLKQPFNAGLTFDVDGQYDSVGITGTVKDKRPINLWTLKETNGQITKQIILI